MATPVTTDELLAAAELGPMPRQADHPWHHRCPWRREVHPGARIVEFLGPSRAVLVPMDGYHLANAVLKARGLRAVKGAIETFDDAGYAVLLQRLAAQRPGETVYAPGFNRDLEAAIAGSIPVSPEVPLVVTEGNYLLADRGFWPQVRVCLTESWFLDPEPEQRRQWLIARHISHGKSAWEARSGLWARMNGTQCSSVRWRTGRTAC